MSTESVRLQSHLVEAIDDPLLAELEETEIARAALFSHMSICAEERENETDEICEFDLEVMKPMAVDIRKLMALADKEIPHNIEAALGPSKPIMVFHGFSPFQKKGIKPAPIWGMGYEVRLDGVDAATIAVEPGSAVEKFGQINQTVNLELEVGGGISVPKGVLELATMLPGISMTGCSVHASTHQQFSLALSLELSLIKTVAAPVGVGGARWDIYRTRERLNRFQPLVQTLLVPKETDTLNFEVETWIKRRGKFFGIIGARVWIFPGQKFEVSLKESVK